MAVTVYNKLSLIKKSGSDSPADLISQTQKHTYIHIHTFTQTQHDNRKGKQYKPRPTNKSAAGEISPAQHPINNSRATGVRANTKKRIGESRTERGYKEGTKLGKAEQEEF